MKLADLATGSDWIVWIVFVIFAVLSIVLLSGHGSWFISGYNAASKEEKKKFGPLAYYFKGMTQLPQQLSTNLHLNVTVDNESFEEDAYMFAITNTNRVGGFDGIIPFADINDGKLDLVIVKRCSVTDLIALIKDYRFGKHDKSPFIHYVQGQHIHITCDQDLTMDIDGEEGTHLPIDVHTLQKSIQLLVPSK